MEFEKGTLVIEVEPATLEDSVKMVVVGMMVG